jgi:hypothetical protein
MVSRRPPPDPGPTLTQAFALLRRAEACAVALEDFGDLELPPVVAGSAADQGTVRAVAALYLAAELESAMLVPAVELLAGLAMSGGLAVADLGDAAESIADFWRGRHERFTAAERGAFFGRLFGGPLAAVAAGRADSGNANDEFEACLIDLCEALYKLDEQAITAMDASPAAHVRLHGALTRLLDNVLRNTNGLSAYVARDCLTATQAALALLRHPRVQTAFAARSPWDVVRVVAQRYLHATPAIAPHVGRGKAGLILLSWAADAIPLLQRSDQPLIGLDHPVIGAAVEWLETSLTLSESVEPAPASPAVAAPGDAAVMRAV